MAKHLPPDGVGVKEFLILFLLVHAAFALPIKVSISNPEFSRLRPSNLLFHPTDGE